MSLLGVETYESYHHETYPSARHVFHETGSLQSTAQSTSKEKDTIILRCEIGG
jgi:hypothetical protein